MRKEMVILCIGDSIVNGYPYARRYSWPNLLAQKLEAEGVFAEVHNEGVNGESTDELRRRFAQAVKTVQPQQVIIASGSNDFIYTEATPNQVFANLEAMYEETAAHGAEPVAVAPLLTIPELASRAWTDGTDYQQMNQNLRELRELIRQYAAAKQMRWIDLQDGYQQLWKNLGTESCYVDGLHPTDIGYGVIAQLVKDSLFATGV